MISSGYGCSPQNQVVQGSIQPGCLFLNYCLKLVSLLEDIDIFLEKNTRLIYFHQAKKKKKEKYLYFSNDVGKQDVGKKDTSKNVFCDIPISISYSVFEKVLSFSKALSENFPGKIMSIRSQITLTLED